MNKTGFFDGIFSYADYEDAYCSGRISDCKAIGIYLLDGMSDSYSMELSRKLTALK